jgi:IS30 family transposase
LLTEQQWSPEKISGHLAKITEHRVSHEAIYLHIYADKDRGGTLFTHLRAGHKMRKRRLNKSDKRGSIKHRTCIEQRPGIVDLKTRLGDLEMDTVIGIQGGAVLVTIVDRMSKYTFIGLSKSKEAGAVGNVIYDLLRDVRTQIKNPDLRQWERVRPPSYH